MGFFNRMAGSSDQFQGRPIGRVLTKMGKVTREQVVEALTEQKSRGGLLGEILVQRGYITPEDVAARRWRHRRGLPADRPFIAIV
jgi:type IV pilus assembly protein PilB